MFAPRYWQSPGSSSLVLCSVWSLWNLPADQSRCSMVAGLAVACTEWELATASSELNKGGSAGLEVRVQQQRDARTGAGPVPY